MERYPRSKQLHKHNGVTEVFRFENLKDYEDKLKEGWAFNPNDLKDKKEVVEENKEVIVEDKPEPFIHRPEVPGVINPEKINPLQCKLCSFVGKNTQSLRMHKFKKHTGK